MKAELTNIDMIRYPWSPDGGESLADAVAYAALMASVTVTKSYQIVRKDCGWCRYDLSFHRTDCHLRESVVEPSIKMIRHDAE